MFPNEPPFWRATWPSLDQTANKSATYCVLWGRKFVTFIRTYSISQKLKLFSFVHRKNDKQSSKANVSELIQSSCQKKSSSGEELTSNKTFTSCAHFLQEFFFVDICLLNATYLLCSCLWYAWGNKTKKNCYVKVNVSSIIQFHVHAHQPSTFISLLLPNFHPLPHSFFPSLLRPEQLLRQATEGFEEWCVDVIGLLVDRSNPLQ